MEKTFPGPPGKCFWSPPGKIHCCPWSSRKLKHEMRWNALACCWGWHWRN